MSKRVLSVLIIVSFFISGFVFAAKPIDSQDMRDKKPGQERKNKSDIALQANDDTATTAQGLSIAINELINDKGVDDPSILVSLRSQPANGSAILQSDNSILYTPADVFTGLDTFEYEVSLMSGETDSAIISVTVDQSATGTGNSCAYTVGLSWSMPSNTDIAGYYVYQGTSSGEYVEKVYVGEVFEYDYCVSSPGEYYFAASAENTFGIESGLTSEIVALVP